MFYKNVSFGRFNYYNNYYIGLLIKLIYDYFKFHYFKIYDYKFFGILPDNN